MMHRNLDRRVEVLVRIPTAENVAEIGALLDQAFAPETDAWVLGQDGDWARHRGEVQLQEALIEAQRKRRHTTG
jgi:polyphosphate kinase